MKHLSFNRGEWSEIYVVLFLLSHPNLVIVDHELNTIDDDTFVVKDVIFVSSNKSKLEETTYSIVGNNIEVSSSGEDKEFYVSKDDLAECRDSIYYEIIHTESKHGSFPISEADDFVSLLTNGKVPKADTSQKSDLELRNLDNLTNKIVRLGYSVKSSLGSPATILNASQHTNFKFKVNNFNDKKMRLVNEIDSRTKLRDRLDKIFHLHGNIEFVDVCSESMKYNLELIDSQMPVYIANSLLQSYSTDNKNLLDVFISSNDFDDEVFAKKKLADFIAGASFGFFPSERWDGLPRVDGGILVVEKVEGVVVLDLVYHEDEVRQYLLNETRLETPSSTRYHMLEIFKEDGQYFFTLNLQVRFKK